MATEPLGTLDHIGIAVNDIHAARMFYEEVLGASVLYTAANYEGGYKLCELDLNGLILELLEPLGHTSFLHQFVNTRGEGIHHLTFKVLNAKRKARELEAQGIRIVGQAQRTPTSYEAFVSPRSSHGVLIQLASACPPLVNDPVWLQQHKTGANV